MNTWIPFCFDPQHEPPNMMVYPPGTHTHVCPGCKREVTFTVGFIY